MKRTLFARILILLLAAALTAGCLIACGDQTETTNQDPTGSSPAPGSSPTASQNKPNETTPSGTQASQPGSTSAAPTNPKPTDPAQPTVPTAPTQPTVPGDDYICPPGNVLVHVYVPQSWDVPNIWAWNSTTMQNLYSEWPGQAMVAHRGHFVIDVPVWVDSLVINGIGGTVQTADLSIESGREVWIVVSDYSCKIYYQQPTEEELNPSTPDLPETVTVHVYAPYDWGTPNLWAWNNQTMQNLYPNWPGQAMNVNGSHFSLEIPSWVDSLVFNGLSGTVQTADISIEMGKNVWVVIHGDNYTIFYSQPTSEQLKELGY